MATLPTPTEQEPFITSGPLFKCGDRWINLSLISAIVPVPDVSEFTHRVYFGNVNILLSKKDADVLLHFVTKHARTEG